MIQQYKIFKNQNYITQINVFGVTVFDGWVFSPVSGDDSIDNLIVALFKIKWK